MLVIIIYDNGMEKAKFFRVCHRVSICVIITLYIPISGKGYE